MTNLPSSTGSGDLDNLAVTRSEFRAEIGTLLEYLAQALGDVGGDYTSEVVNPQTVILQGTPTLEAGATPAGADASQSIPCTKWVKESGVYSGDTGYATPVKAQLWVDTSTAPYTIKSYNEAASDWQLIGGVPSGTRMLFQQEAAPLGWTKVTSGVDNMALRVTTGNPSIVNSNQPFTTAFNNKPVSGSVDEHQLTISEMPSHNHGVTDNGHGHDVSSKSLTGGFNPGTHTQVNASGVFSDGGNQGTAEGSDATNGRRVNMNATHNHTASSNISNISVQSNGSDGLHSHGFSGGSINLNVNYVDVIVATKD